MVVVLIVSLVVGICLAEIVARTICFSSLRIQIREVGVLLHSFHTTEGDDARQALLLRAGVRTLLFSLKTLALLIALSGIVYLPIGVLQPQFRPIVYLVATSLVSIVWWIFVRSRCKAGS